MTQDDSVAAACYVAACEAELKAFKPGNVSVYSAAHDMTVEDFRRSAKASAPFVAASALSIGERIFRAIEATRTVVDCNTNLGIVLLAVPLIAAWQAMTNSGASFRAALDSILATTTVGDADWVYRAIRLAAPGGLGSAEAQDVQSKPDVSLTQAMALAASRDRIAFQYTNSFTDVLDFAIPRYHYALTQWGDEQWAAVAVFVGLLSRIPDSHIERKFGARHTRMVTDRMLLIERALSGGERKEILHRMLEETDAEFKSLGINPGTTADLTVACLLAVRLGAP